jgi:hypothetical protein
MNFQKVALELIMLLINFIQIFYKELIPIIVPNNLCSFMGRHSIRSLAIAALANYISH